MVKPASLASAKAVLPPWRPERPAITHDLPRIVGHRGAAGLAPENTLAGIRKAAEIGCRWVEVDAKLAADGEIVLMHDDRLERTTDGQGLVRHTTFAALRALDAGAWFGPAFAGERIPTLAETIALVREFGLGINVEIKPCRGRGIATGEAVARELMRLAKDGLPPLLLSSFDFAALDAARKVAPDLSRGLLFNRRLPWRWPTVLRAHVGASLHVNHVLLSEWRMRGLKAAGVPVLAYTVDDPVRARALLAWGVDALFTDRPDLVLPVAKDLP